MVMTKQNTTSKTTILSHQIIDMFTQIGHLYKKPVIFSYVIKKVNVIWSL